MPDRGGRSETIQAPGSDQIHRESGTSTVGEGDRNKSDHGKRRRRGGKAAAAERGVEERGGRRLEARVSMTFRVVMTNQYNQDLGLIYSTNGNHLESPNEGSSIDHQVTIHLRAQNITMFPTNETWYFTSQMLVSSSGGLILILTAQSTRNEFRIHSDY
ncbi:hypothetical protein F511_11500 [Dorcoceras hygrometricum]|uniref:Uncharacterized protein n=1 Tax=Dorcoceras hygrometricum TaxID=472368 RepID=A0A2Z7D921_9LAMI|nr:hypothetical protein F511_11500 [Dorcoceras hygrometricum]